MKAKNNSIPSVLFFATVTALVLSSGCSPSSAPGGSTDSTNAAASTPVVVSAPAKAEDASVVEALIATNQIVSDVSTDGKPIIEVQIRDVTSSDRSPHEKAIELLEMLPKLSHDAQRKVAHAAVAQVGDHDFDLIRKQLLNPKLDPQVLSVFMTDTLKREDEIRLPMLKEMARLEGHPLQAEARELLPALLSAKIAGDSPH